MTIKILPAGSAQPDAGFTLLELLVTLAIMALLLMVFPVAFTARGGALELNAEARTLANELRGLRAEAISTGRSTVLDVDLAGRSYVGSRSGKVHRLPSDVDLTISTQSWTGVRRPATAVTFFGDGTSSGANIILSRRTLRVAVSVAVVSGRIAIDE